MYQYKIHWFFLSILFSVFKLTAQTVSATLVDVESNIPIPFATIQTDLYNGVMSNGEGVFTISVDGLKQNKDSLTISCMGYKTLKIPIKKSLEKTIKLTPEIYEIIPVFLSSKKYTADEIIDNVKKNMAKNYSFDFQKSELFIRQTNTGNMLKFKFTLLESSLQNINQKLIDDTFKNIKKKYIYLNETLADAIIKSPSETKLNIKKSLSIQSKEELTSAKKMQEDFMKIMNDNFKSDSQLILKTGIIRLEKTESIDSLIREMDSENKKSTEDKNKNFHGYKTKSINNLVENLFINKKSDVDFINKSSKYNFVKNGYSNYDGEWVYILDFSPKGNGKFKGKLYIDAITFAIVKAEFRNAQNIYDKRFNMFGIKSNAISYKSTILFKKENNKFVLKYLMKESSDEVGIDRPLTVIEKNENTKGKKRINRVEVQMDMYVINQNKLEIVFSKNALAKASDYDKMKPNIGFESTKLYQYDTAFWNGYNIITPEKATQELKIEN